MRADVISGHETVVLSGLMHNVDIPISAVDFSSPPNRIIFEAIHSLNGNRNMIAVTDALRKKTDS